MKYSAYKLNKQGDKNIHSTRARYHGMWSQMGLRKHHYEQKLVEVMEFQLSYFKS